MNILIVGGGHLGRTVAEELNQLGHGVAIIEQSADKLAILEAEFEGAVFKSFPMDISNLREAGIANCDAVAVTTSDDNLNITVGQIAKQVFGVENVVARISDPLREEIFEEFGLKTVCPTKMSSHSIVRSIVAPYETKTMSFGSSVISFDRYAMDRKFVGHKLCDIYKEMKRSYFGVVTKNEKFIYEFETSEHIIDEDDMLIVTKQID